MGDGDGDDTLERTAKSDEDVSLTSEVGVAAVMTSSSVDVLSRNPGLWAMCVSVTLDDEGVSPKPSLEVDSDFSNKPELVLVLVPKPKPEPDPDPELVDAPPPPNPSSANALWCEAKTSSC